MRIALALVLALCAAPASAAGFCDRLVRLSTHPLDPLVEETVANCRYLESLDDAAAADAQAHRRIDDGVSRQQQRTQQMIDDFLRRHPATTQ
jgi:hypothetical protein